MVKFFDDGAGADRVADSCKLIKSDWQFCSVLFSTGHAEFYRSPLKYYYPNKNNHGREKLIDTISF
jgi:hypothetical protein